MASIIPGYNYDIFISYRQKDNKGDRWVSEFVDALKDELESTFKEEISVYFDINPHDGLLETHSVDQSLEDKLKCLILIPIISRTYCDPKCFAWQNEFCVFNKLAKEDKFGRDIKLAGGNVASRILPVKIHDLDPEDQALLENELGGALRGVELIYKSSGVNRPLRANEDHPQDNLNKTYYRDQINKVANAAKEIVTGLRDKSAKSGTKRKSISSVDVNATMKGKSIVVLPFENISPDKDIEYFCDGITEEIINAITKVEDLFVVARTSAFSFKGKNIDVREIGNRLGVENLLEGSVRKSGNRLRITAQLINIENGYHIWSEKFDTELADIFEIQDEIAMQIVNKLKISIKPHEEDMLVRRYTNNLEAYNLYLKGRYHWNKLTEEGLLTGMDFFRQSISNDREYAPAYSGIADCYCRLAWYSYIPPENAFKRAKEIAEKALKSDKYLPEAYASLGFVSMCYERNYIKAEKEIRKAIRLNPGYAGAHSYYSICLVITGRYEDSIKEGKKALELDPLTPMMLINLGARYYYNRQFNLCIETIKKTFEIDPGFIVAHYYLAYFYNQMRMYETAIAEINKVISALGRNNAQFLAALGIILASSGDVKGAEKVIDEIVLLSKEKYTTHFWLAVLYVCLGRKSEAFKCLEKAFRSREVLMIFLNADPVFDSIRPDPRFRLLLRKMNFI